MKYRIPALSSVAMSTTGCLFADPVEGEWTLGESDPLCMEYQKTYTYDGYETSVGVEICLNFAQFDFSVTSPETDVIAAEITSGNGTVDFGYSYVYDGETETESYQYDFATGNGVDFVMVSEDSYKMTLEVNLATENEEVSVDAVLNCTLTDKKSMNCQQEDLVLDGESYAEVYDFSGALTLTK